MAKNNTFKRDLLILTVQKLHCGCVPVQLAIAKMAN